MGLQYDLKKAALADVKNNVTAKAYKESINAFSDWAKSKGVTKMNNVTIDVVQEYEKALEDKNYSPATIHSRLAPVCKALQINMKLIEKPRRTAGSIKKGRIEDKLTRSKAEEEKDKYKRLVEFQKGVGIRRKELANLTGNCLKRDESGKLCISVERGKGGKYQLQRILPAHIETVTRIVSEVGKNEKVFKPEEMQNHINLHNMRSDMAKEAYRYYLTMDKDVLRKELIERFKRYHRGGSASLNKFKQDLYGTYTLKADNKAMAASKNLPLVYDRLALMAVSVFHLSHWRLDVTVTNYMAK